MLMINDLDESWRLLSIVHSNNQMFVYQQTHQYFAQITSGIEELGIEELSKIGAQNIEPGFRGIYFEADPATMYRINYTARYITRVLAPLIKFQCDNTRHLYNQAKAIDWTQFFTVDQTFAIFATVSNSQIRHSQYAALCVKDAIADHFSEKFEKRPNVARINPDAWVNLHIEHDWATISFDMSGGSLHRRGYRQATLEAPMQETVAAAMIRLTEWDGAKPLYDPMCGSGTLLAEALMYYCQIPSGYLRRKFGFELLPDFDRTIWESVKKEADRQIREPPAGLIAGSDRSSQAIEIATANLYNLPFGDKINLSILDFRQIDQLKNTVIVCNPPYGVRLGKKNEVSELYRSLGDFLKQRCNSANAFIYFGDRHLISDIRLKTSWKKPLSNGGLDGRLVKFEIY